MYTLHALIQDLHLFMKFQSNILVLISLLLHQVNKLQVQDYFYMKEHFQVSLLKVISSILLLLLQLYANKLQDQDSMFSPLLVPLTYQKFQSQT